MTLEFTAHQLARGDGPRLVFLHALGALTSGPYANELAGLLNRSCGAGMVGLDAPGFGDAPRAGRDDYEISGYAAAVPGRPRRRGRAGRACAGRCRPRCVPASAPASATPIASPQARAWAMTAGSRRRRLAPPIRVVTTAARHGPRPGAAFAAARPAAGRREAE